MRKMIKQCYYSKDGEKRVNCYHIILSKKIVTEAGIGENDEIEIIRRGNEIIIKKK